MIYENLYSCTLSYHICLTPRTDQGNDCYLTPKYIINCP